MQLWQGKKFLTDRIKLIRDTKKYSKFRRSMILP